MALPQADHYSLAFCLYRGVMKQKGQQHHHGPQEGGTKRGLSTPSPPIKGSGQAHQDGPQTKRLKPPSLGTPRTTPPPTLSRPSTPAAAPTTATKSTTTTGTKSLRPSIGSTPKASTPGEGKDCDRIDNDSVGGDIDTFVCEVMMVD